MPLASSQNDTSLQEILHPPEYRPRWLHFVLVFTELVGRVPPLKLSPALLAMVAIACWPWGNLRVAAAATSLAFLLLDGAGLALLPKLNRSFGPVTPPLLALTLVRSSLTFCAGLLSLTPVTLYSVITAQLGISAISLYATWIEPFRIQVTREELRSPKLQSAEFLRLVHISDLHVEKTTARERKVLELVEDLKPALIALTGDYLNLSSVRDPAAQKEAQNLLADLCERARSGYRSDVPVYAITGSPPVDLKGVVPEIFEGLPITWLLDEVVDLDYSDLNVSIVGLRCTRERVRDASRLRELVVGIPEERLVVLLYHSPDLMPEAVELGVDLYLCGHTHGGQIRLPLIGAVITSSEFWKRYEMGRYDEGGTTLYVSRGLGMEGLGAPRARFLSPPEITEWTLSGLTRGRSYSVSQSPAETRHSAS